jgi:hypothetical protein
MEYQVADIAAYKCDSSREFVRKFRQFRISHSTPLASGAYAQHPR